MFQQSIRPLRLTALICSLTGCLYGEVEPAVAPSTLPVSEEVFNQLTERVSFIEKKLQLLGSNDESELLGLRSSMESPADLLEEAKRLLASEDYKQAYYLLRGIHLLNPDFDEEAQACQYAAGIAGILYRQNRYAAPKSAWVLSEPETTFQWMCSLQTEDADMHKTIFEAAFMGTPMPYWKRFVRFQETYFAEHLPWTLRVSEDNGRIDSIEFIDR